MSEEQPKLVYSVSEVARLLGCSPWTVRLWERQGRLQAIRLGKLVRFRREEVLRFIESASAK